MKAPFSLIAITRVTGQAYQHTSQPGELKIHKTPGRDETEQGGVGCLTFCDRRSHFLTTISENHQS